MDPVKSPTGSMRRHRPRRSTRGPLDAVDDPLAEPPPKSPSVTSAQSPEQATLEIVDAKPPEDVPPPVDLSFLQDLSNYLPISTDDIPQSFLDSPNQPTASTQLPSLLEHGHFRLAATTALDSLLQSSPNEARQILELFYTRLACLILISKPDIAAHESGILTDFLARSPPGAEDIVQITPWELRLLLVRLQAIGAADGGRRGIMSLYALAGEVRARMKLAREQGNEDEVSKWAGRLSDLGLRVVDTLVEMGELETATRHLDTLVDVEGDELAYRRSLLRLRVGDGSGARRCIDSIKDPTTKASLDSLSEVANGHFAKAVDQLQKLSEYGTQHDLFASNLAVGLLYTGHIAQARDIFEGLVRRSPAFAGLLFNLGTVYELCTEEAVQRKIRLVQDMAEKTPVPDTGGWERGSFEFKL